MAYTKIGFKNGGSPPINATNLNKMDQGIYDAHAEMADLADDILLETTLTENLVEIIQNVDPNIYELVYLFFKNLKSSTSTRRYLYTQFNDNSNTLCNFLQFKTNSGTINNYSNQSNFYIYDALSNQSIGNNLFMRINLNTNSGYYELTDFVSNIGVFGNFIFNDENNPISKIRLYPSFDSIGIGTKVKIIGVKKVV